MSCCILQASPARKATDRVMSVLAALCWSSLLLAPAGYADEPFAEEVVVTASQFEEPVFLAQYSVDVIGADRIRLASFRSTPDIFREIPGTLLQKTSHGQGSPYIRGFTGFRNLFLIDGIRLNNAVFRDGPNQYWSTVDAGSIARLEVVRGPKSVLYGSDAIGGTVNVFSRGPGAFHSQEDFAGGLSYRYGSGENSHIARAEADLTLGERSGLFIGASFKDFGDIEAGSGALPNTGYEEWSLDTKLVHGFDDNLTFTAAHMQIHQDDVPRTHKTVFSRSYEGTSIGGELMRDLDQDRILTYARLEAAEWLGWQRWSLTLFQHRQQEERERLRSGNRRDKQGFEVATVGFTLAASRATAGLGLFTAGVDWAHDKVDSFSSRNSVQGPVADDASYDWAGLFVQNRYSFSSSVDLTTGLRLGYFEVDAGSISDPVDGSMFSYQQDWSEPVGNIRLGWSPVADRVRLYGGISQGFRAPNLSDLTRFDSARSNEFEVPSVNLDPERYVSYEVGGRFSDGRFAVESAIYYTDIKDQIQRLLTGRVNDDGEQEVTKANVGDGHLQGIELKGSWVFAEDWLAFGHFAWLDGEISTEAVVGTPALIDYHSRMMPTNYRIGLRYEPVSPRDWWFETEVVLVEDADKISLRDQSDTQRIPPGGTPGYKLWHARGGVQLNDKLYLNLVLENLLDEDYRVHGSGQNEPGRNLVVSIDYGL